MSYFKKLKQQLDCQQILTVQHEQPLAITTILLIFTPRNILL